MPAKKVEVEKEAQESKRPGILDVSRKILLAAIGAAVVAEEEINTLVSRLVDRGELAEGDARKLVKEVFDRRESMAREKIAEVRRNRPVTVATKSDIEALNARITELTEKLEALKTEK